MFFSPSMAGLSLSSFSVKKVAERQKQNLSIGLLQLFNQISCRRSKY